MAQVCPKPLGRVEGAVDEGVLDRRAHQRAEGADRGRVEAIESGEQGASPRTLVLQRDHADGRVALLGEVRPHHRTGQHSLARHPDRLGDGHAPAGEQALADMAHRVSRIEREHLDNVGDRPVDRDVSGRRPRLLHPVNAQDIRGHLECLRPRLDRIASGPVGTTALEEDVNELGPLVRRDLLEERQKVDQAQLSGVGEVTEHLDIRDPAPAELLLHQPGEVLEVLRPQCRRPIRARAQRVGGPSRRSAANPAQETHVRRASYAVTGEG